jgi:hypothetical protein
MLVGTSPYQALRTCQISQCTFVLVELKFGTSFEKTASTEFPFLVRWKEVKETS